MNSQKITKYNTPKFNFTTNTPRIPIKFITHLVSVGELVSRQQHLQAFYLLPLQTLENQTLEKQTLEKPIPPAKPPRGITLHSYLHEFQVALESGEEVPTVPPECSSFQQVFPQPADISRNQLDFVLKQVVLQTKDDTDSLARFVASIPQELSGVTEYLLAVKVMVSFNSKNYPDVFDILESNNFTEIPWEPLQRLWFEARYDYETVVKGRKLGAVDKYRVRKKYPLPVSISDGSGSCLFGVNRDLFTPQVRRVLWDHYHRNKFPDTTLKILIAKQSGLTFAQVNNWFKNRRQRDRMAMNKKRIYNKIGL